MIPGRYLAEVVPILRIDPEDAIPVIASGSIGDLFVDEAEAHKQFLATSPELCLVVSVSGSVVISRCSLSVPSRARKIWGTGVIVNSGSVIHVSRVLDPINGWMRIWNQHVLVIVGKETGPLLPVEPGLPREVDVYASWRRDLKDLEVVERGDLALEGTGTVYRTIEEARAA